MNLGQTFITLGMLSLLLLSVLSANRMIMDVNETTYQAEAMTASSTIANDLLDEILTKRFDQFSDSTGSQPKSAFSPPPTTIGGTNGGVEWGPSATEKSNVGALDSSYTGNFKSITKFDDVDDYNGYQRMITINNMSGFIATVQVDYVNSNYPDTPLTTQNTYKRVLVSVSHPIYLKTPVTYSALISY
jgi:hypothetical protein